MPSKLSQINGLIFWLRLALQKWEGIEARLKNVDAGKMYKHVVAKTGHHL